MPGGCYIPRVDSAPTRERALVVEEAGPVAEALRAHLEAAGFAVDVAPPASALEALRPVHALAIVRAARPDLLAQLRARDRTLAVAVLHRDEGEAAAAPDDLAARADGVLVGPLTGVQVAATSRALARLSAQARRIAALERAASPARVRFELHRRLVLAEIRRARRYRYPLSLVLVALDDWRDLAASLGADGRARVLGEVLALVARSLRNVDLPVLHAEERFLLVLPHTDADGAQLAAGRILERLAAWPGPPKLRASAGLACLDPGAPVSFGALLADASRALERARADGGARVVRARGGRPERKIDFGW
jgi:diguanylate cyclase (GGDEF)-like protein